MATSSIIGSGSKGTSTFTSGVFLETFIGSTLKSGIAASSKTNSSESSSVEISGRTIIS